MNKPIIYPKKSNFQLNYPRFSSALPIQFATITVNITGKTYENAPVNSNIITVRETVIRVTPASEAAAPTIAYVPGVTHLLSRQEAKSQKVGLFFCQASIIIPKILPKDAPIVIDGMLNLIDPSTYKIPAGTLIPNVIIVRKILIIIITKSEVIFDQNKLGVHSPCKSCSTSSHSRKRFATSSEPFTLKIT